MKTRLSRLFKDLDLIDNDEKNDALDSAAMKLVEEIEDRIRASDGYKDVLPIVRAAHAIKESEEVRVFTAENTRLLEIVTDGKPFGVNEALFFAYVVSHPSFPEERF